MGSTGKGKQISEEDQYSVGFRFLPTDEELVVNFLMPKVLNLPLPNRLIKHMDFYSSYPWDLHSQLRINRVKETYVFTPTAELRRSNRALEDGFWKLVDIVSVMDAHQEIIGVRRTFVFHNGSLSRSERTDWVVHEYNTNQDPDSNPEPTAKKPVSSEGWVLCKLFNRCGVDDEGEKEAILLEYDLKMEKLRRRGFISSTQHLPRWRQWGRGLWISLMRLVAFLIEKLMHGKPPTIQA